MDLPVKMEHKRQSQSTHNRQQQEALDTGTHTTNKWQNGNGGILLSIVHINSALYTQVADNWVKQCV